MQHPAFHHQFRPGSAMDSAIDPAAAQQRGVGGIDDSIDLQLGDVAADNIDGDVDAGSHEGCYSISMKSRAMVPLKVRICSINWVRYSCRPCTNTSSMRP